MRIINPTMRYYCREDLLSTWIRPPPSAFPDHSHVSLPVPYTHFQTDREYCIVRRIVQVSLPILQMGSNIASREVNYSRMLVSLEMESY